MKTALITGVTGQDGSFLSEFLLSKGYEVHGTIRRSSVDFRERIAHLEGQPHFHFVDEKMLRTPIIAVNQVKLEIENMAAVAIHNFNLAIDRLEELINLGKEDHKMSNATATEVNTKSTIATIKPTMPKWQLLEADSFLKVQVQASNATICPKHSPTLSLPS